jgi:hypothetical protein
MGAEGTGNTELLVALLAVRSEMLFVCIQDWHGFSHSRNPSLAVDARLTGVQREAKRVARNPSVIADFVSKENNWPKQGPYILLLRSYCFLWKRVPLYFQ